MPKLNKTQTLELMLSLVSTTVATHSDLLKKDKADTLVELLQAELTHHFSPKHGGGTSTKINDDGEVYCNYFETYFPANEFNTKLGKADKDTGVRTKGYKANSIVAEQILRKVKTLRLIVERQVLINLKDKTIDAVEMETMLTNLDTMLEAKFTAVDDVPTVADVVGLNTNTKSLA